MANVSLYFEELSFPFLSSSLQKAKSYFKKSKSPFTLNTLTTATFPSSVKSRVGSINNHLQHQVSLIILHSPSHSERTWNALEALELLSNEFRQVWEKRVTARNQLDSFLIRVGISEYAYQVDFSQRSGGDGKGLNGASHSDQHYSATGTGGLHKLALEV